MGKKRPLIILILLIIVIGGVVFARRTINTSCDTSPELETRTLSGNGRVLTAEVAGDNASRVRGLSGRNCLGKTQAMLFTYDLSGDYCFWMKEMHFPIDMIWLDDEKKIVTVREKVAPDTYPQEFCPDRPAQYVIEVKAGNAAKLGWQLGTPVSF